MHAAVVPPFGTLAAGHAPPIHMSSLQPVTVSVLQRTQLAGHRTGGFDVCDVGSSSKVPRAHPSRGGNQIIVESPG